MQTLRDSAPGIGEGWGAHFSSSTPKPKEIYFQRWPCKKSRAQRGPIETASSTYKSRGLISSSLCQKNLSCAWLREGCIPQQGIPTGNKRKNMFGLWCSLTFHMGSDTLAVFLLFSQMEEGAALCLWCCSQDWMIREDKVTDNSTPTPRKFSQLRSSSTVSV